MHLIRTSILLGLLSTVACNAQDYQGEYPPHNVGPYAVQPTIPGYPTYQGSGYAAPSYVTQFAYDTNRSRVGATTTATSARLRPP